MPDILHRSSGALLHRTSTPRLRDAGLAGAVLRYAALAGADLAGVNLAGADLANADLSGACLDGANLTGADLCAANLTGASLRNATLIDARLLAMNASGARFDGADLTRTSCKFAVANEATSFANVVLVRSHLASVTFPGADLSGADLGEASLIQANLAGARLHGASLAAAVLSASQLTSASLRDADLTFAFFREVELSGVDFDRAMLGKTVFAFCPSLTAARNLESAAVSGPLSLDARTLAAGPLPAGFLEAAQPPASNPG